MTRIPSLSLFLLTLLSSALLMACGADEAPAEDGVVRIEVGASGYDPGEVQATAGQELTLEFTRVTDEGCGQELVIASQDIRRDLPLNEAVRVSFTPSESGRLRFTCGMDMYDGVIVVR